MSSPTYTGLSSYDLLDSAMSQPLSLTSTLWQEGKGGALESFGLGTALRYGNLPEQAPVQEGTDANGNAIVGPGQVYVPPDVGMRDALMGNWGDTPAQLEQRRQQAGALTEDQYKASPSYRKDIPYDPGMTETRATALAAMDDARKVREFYAQKRPLAAFLGSMAGQALDPINYIPVGGPLVKAAALGRFGKIGGEALAAGLDAAANTAVFGIGTANMRAQLGDDVSWQALISQIATAGLIGSAFGTIHGAIGSRVDARLMSEAEQRLSTLRTTQEARIALNEGIDAIVRGEDVNLSPNSTEPLARVADQLEAPTPRSPGKAEPPVPEGFVRLYHSGSVGEGDSGRWVSTNREYASNYRSDLPLHYLDIPASDLRVNNPDIPEQGVKQGFTFNFETTPKEAAQLKEISRAQPARYTLVQTDHGDMALPEPKAGVDDRVYAIHRNGEPVAYANIRVSGDTADVRDLYSVTDTRHGLLGTAAVRRILRDFLRENPEIKTLTGERVTGARFGGTDHGFFGEGVPFKMDVSAARPEPRPEGIKQAEASVAKPEDTKALAAQYSVDPATGAFPEEAQVAQLATEGRLTPDDAANLAQAEADYHAGASFGEALKSIVGCLL
jgi:hypothetical protein